MKMLRGVSYKIGNRLSKAPVGKLTKHGKKHAARRPEGKSLNIGDENSYTCKLRPVLSLM